jgi:Mn-dependent DtxR family transcriptional regulator
VASPVLTGSQSGSQTPGKNPLLPDRGRKIAKDLKRVKRALKTLGVNIIEYDEHGLEGEACLRYRMYCMIP